MTGEKVEKKGGRIRRKEGRRVESSSSAMEEVLESLGMRSDERKSGRGTDKHTEREQTQLKMIRMEGERDRQKQIEKRGDRGGKHEDGKKRLRVAGGNGAKEMCEDSKRRKDKRTQPNKGDEAKKRERGRKRKLDKSSSNND